MLRKLFLGLALLTAWCAVTARAQTIVITPNTTSFNSAGGSITFTTTITYSTVPSVLAFSTTLPTNWTFTSVSGANVPPIAPSAGATGTLSFSYITTPSSPASFTFTATYPASLTGLQPLSTSTVTRDTPTSSAVTTTGPTLTLSAPPIAGLWLGGTGNWTNSTQWSGSIIPSNSGLSTYSAQVGAGTATIGSAISINSLQLSGGSLTGSGSLTLVDTGSTWTGGAFASLAQLVIGSNGQFTASTANPHDFTGTVINNQGQFTWVDLGTLSSTNGGQFNNSGTFTDSTTGGTAHISNSGAGSFTMSNSGTYTKTGSSETKIEVPFTNSGTITVNAGNLHFDSTFTQSAGNINVASGATSQFDNGLNLAAGSLIGGGTILGNVTNSALISPGNTIGQLTIQGNLTLLSTSQLLFDISAANATPGVTYDFLSVTGTAALGGTLALNVTGTGRSTILSSDTFTLVTGASLTGTFSNVPNVAGGFRLMSNGGQGSFLVSYTGTSVVLSQFNPIPEPSTWALLATGLGALTFVAVRRRAKK